MKPIKITVIVLFLILIFLISSILYDFSQEQIKITGKSTSTFVGNFSVRIDPGIKVYDFTFDGNTTNFLYMNDTELEHITNMTLEKIKYGKIVYNYSINLTQCAIGNVVDLDSYVTINHNITVVQAGTLQCLNATAIIVLRELPFINPRILRDFVPCPKDICTKIHYVNQTLVFTVAKFSNYSADEAPERIVANTTQLFINSSLGTNLSTEDITCYAEITDDINLSVLAQYNWYADGVLITSGTTTMPNGTLTNVSTIDSSNLVPGEIWTCEVRGGDGEYIEVDWNNATITILSSISPTPPSIGGGGGGAKSPPSIIPPEIRPELDILFNTTKPIKEKPTLLKEKDMERGDIFEIIREQPSIRLTRSIRNVPDEIIYKVAITALFILTLLILLKETIKKRRKK